MGPLPSRIWRITEQPARPGIPSCAALVSSNRPSGKPRCPSTDPETDRGRPAVRSQNQARTALPPRGLRLEPCHEPGSVARQIRCLLRRRTGMPEARGELASAAKTDYAPPLAFAPAGG